MSNVASPLAPNRPGGRKFRASRYAFRGCHGAGTARNGRRESASPCWRRPSRASSSIFVATGAGVAGAGYFQIPVPKPIDPERPVRAADPGDPGRAARRRRSPAAAHAARARLRPARQELGRRPSSPAQAESPHSDTIVLVRLDPKRNRIAVLSLPRDLAVTIPGYADNTKINQAYDEGGAGDDARDGQAPVRERDRPRSSRSTASSTSTSTASSRRSTTSRASTSTSTATTTTPRAPGSRRSTSRRATSGSSARTRSPTSATATRTPTSSATRASRSSCARPPTSPSVEKLKSVGRGAGLPRRDASAYFRFDKKFLTRKNIAGLLKTGVSTSRSTTRRSTRSRSRGSPSPRTRPTDTRLYISNENLKVAYDEFMTGEGTRNPKRETQGQDGQEAGQGVDALSGLENARRLGEDMAVLASRRLKTLPFYFPEYRTTGSRYVNDTPRIYSDARRAGQAPPRLPDRDLQRRARRVLRRPGP